MSNNARTEITKLYIATFNRAPDSAGLNYWSNKITNDGWTVEMVAQSFFDQPETQALYAAGSATQSFVEAVYNNVLQRTADTEGLNYWVNNIDSGSLGRHELIVAMINAVNAGSSAEDLSLLSNRANIGESFAQAGLDSVDLAREVLLGITGDQSTLATGMQKIQDYLTNYSQTDLFDAGGAMRLDFSSSGTVSSDVVSTSLNNSSITKVIQTLAGNDTINITSSNITDKAVLLGGLGDDTYQLGSSGLFIVYDAGGNDTLEIRAHFDDLYAATVNNGDDLIIFDDQHGVLLPDWQATSNRFETIRLTNASYSYTDLVQAVAAYTEGDFPDSVLNLVEQYTNFAGSELDRHLELFEHLGNMNNTLAESLSPVELSETVNSNNLADYLL